MEQIRVVGTFLLVALMPSFVSPVPTSAQRQPLPSCQALAKRAVAMETSCLCTDDLDRRHRLTDAALRIQRAADVLGCQDVTVLTDLCGGFFDDETTFIDVTPFQTSLDPEETIQLSAVISGVACFDCGRRQAEMCTPEPAILTGDIVWASLSPDVATVDQNGLVTALAQGEATIVVLNPDYPHIKGEVLVEVSGPQKIDVAFVIKNDFALEWLIGGLGERFEDAGLPEHLPEILEALDHFSSYRVAIVGYHNFPDLDIMGTLETCPEFGYPAPVRPFADMLDFTGDDELITEGFEGFELTCAGQRIRAYSVYSGLMHAIDAMTLGGWREEADVKVIFLVTDEAQCKPGYDCDVFNPEPYTGYLPQNVIDGALSKNIEIHTFPLRDYTSSTVYQWIDDQLGVISRETGGDIHPHEPFWLIHEAIIDTILQLSIQNDA